VLFIKRKNSALAICSLIGLCFLLTGSEYITWWLYRLTPHFGTTGADIWSEVVGYLFQATGILLFSFAIKKNKKALCRRNFLYLVLADGAATAVAFFVPGVYSILIAGMLMNLLHGMIGGYYLTRLTQLVTQQKRGVVFGVAYAFGSIGSWLLSLFMDGEYLGSPYVFVIYALMILAIILVDRMPVVAADNDAESAEPLYFDRLSVPLAAGLVVLLSVVKGLGFYFPSIDATGGVVSAESVRAFYAIGLIAAGIINDKNRKHGAICCLCALVFPFLTFALRGEPNTGAVLWIAGYVFFGFFSVYRVVTFSDLSGKKDGLLFIAGFGLMFGRIGDALGALIGIMTTNMQTASVWIAAGLLIATFLLFFRFYNKTYSTIPLQNVSLEDRLHIFEEKYELTSREAEVFELIVSGRSNSEIAADLFVSESTVKFHVRNALRKAGCMNRTELAAKFRKSGMS